MALEDVLAAVPELHDATAVEPLAGGLTNTNYKVQSPRGTYVVRTGQKPQAMEKDEKGIWTATVGPLKPEVYVYMFSVDGVRVADPNNPNDGTGVICLALVGAAMLGRRRRFA